MQLKLFDDVLLLEDNLIADSPKKAFWRLKLIFRRSAYYIVKESGANGRLLDRRVWPQKDCQTAEKVYWRKVAAKLDPTRKNPRKYRICNVAKNGIMKN